MKRRKFLQSTAATIGTSALAVSAFAQSKSSFAVVENGQIIHSVYFWLKEELTAQQVKDFTKFFEALRKVPNIKSLRYGRPAETSKRPVVDNSWTYNLIVVFEKMEYINTYETHPIHLKAIEDFSSNWTKVLVHDTQLD
ncbi:Dabb family protein [Sphingobacterium spiritivorum]|uniref:Dabb family protein n=1 Tax=Sphingobacterium spiritivorum TaxID=258 RepID=UPI003DA31E6F